MKHTPCLYLDVCVSACLCLFVLFDNILFRNHHVLPISLVLEILHFFFLVSSSRVSSSQTAGVQLGRRRHCTGVVCSVPGARCGLQCLDPQGRMLRSEGLEMGWGRGCVGQEGRRKEGVHESERTIWPTGYQHMHHDLSLSLPLSEILEKRLSSRMFFFYIYAICLSSLSRHFSLSMICIFIIIRPRSVATCSCP